jgi:hypothetical protein
MKIFAGSSTDDDLALADVDRHAHARQRSLVTSLNAEQASPLLTSARSSPRPTSGLKIAVNNDVTLQTTPEVTDSAVSQNIPKLELNVAVGNESHCGTILHRKETLRQANSLPQSFDIQRLVTSSLPGTAQNQTPSTVDSYENQETMCSINNKSGEQSIGSEELRTGEDESNLGSSTLIPLNRR